MRPGGGSREQERKIFGFIENGLWKKRKPRRSRATPPPPRDAKVSADGDGARRGGRRGRAGVSASHLPLGPHPVDPVLSTLALGRLEFLSPWGGSILCFHHTVFMVTWERRETT